MSSDSVIVENRGPVRIVTLNRPEKRNAVDIAVRLELGGAIEDAGQDDSVRAIVLTGAGSAFCSGGDITSMERMPPGRAMERTQLAQRVIRAIWNAGKPVVAAVEGSAFGAGVALAAACDRVVAARGARFATTFTNVGLAGDMGTFASLPSRVGVARARQMLMMPTPIDAPTALDLGLVDALVDPGTALAAALADAERLAAGPTRAYGVIKTMLAAGSALSPFELLDLEAEHQSQLFDSDDFAEGIAAFREKRRPQFGSAPP
ncbi:enoyl-CoA hydratase/isomerase family protein [Mycobacterium stomatepiae]|uniref:Enoyl-CoA hydratase n=1 Tax=Mycobacterium stomatepiae TaxID=470076 RepID=A0A7I7QHL1_9MYCO|nr:enoyl-CoA hydratase-related protein [Mycobacterium stomatepiae]MCV7166078.1 enoyl-CoA hydratase/isomerase family protein [Mycobacterium stomatepiae]BBY25751.1 enoyl-CoA hydratase [Mycobacterium stomatepiae]